LGILLKHVNTVNFGYNKIKIADTWHLIWLVFMIQKDCFLYKVRTEA
jgi:hypothetical protein